MKKKTVIWVSRDKNGQSVSSDSSSVTSWKDKYKPELEEGEFVTDLGRYIHCVCSGEFESFTGIHIRKGQLLKVTIEAVKL